MRKPIGKLYSITSVLTYEPLMDATIQTLIDKLAIVYCGSNGNQVCEIDKWLYYCMRCTCLKIERCGEKMY